MFHIHPHICKVTLQFCALNTFKLQKRDLKIRKH